MSSNPGHVDQAQALKTDPDLSQALKTDPDLAQALKTDPDLAQTVADAAAADSANAEQPKGKDFSRFSVLV